MKPFTLKKRKKREVWVVPNANEFSIKDPETELLWDQDNGWSDLPFVTLFATRHDAEVFAKSKNWKVV